MPNPTNKAVNLPGIRKWLPWVNFKTKFWNIAKPEVKSQSPNHLERLEIHG